MSEHQVVAFRAMDAPVSAENLEFMRKQSSRANITPWSFDNEYHYGDFRGNAKEMLRRGYDFHLHYANYGIRSLWIRLPRGFFDSQLLKAFLVNPGLKYIKDENGPGGILAIQPYYEAAYLDEIWEIGELIQRLLPLRAELLDGDPRSLYLANLAVAGDCNNYSDDTMEAPIPAGLGSLTDAQLALVEFFDISETLIAAAAQESPPLSARPDSSGKIADWIRRQDVETKDRWLAAWLGVNGASVRSEVLAKYQREEPVLSWPMSEPQRTLGKLQKMAEQIEAEEKQRAAEKQAEVRAQRLSLMARDPKKTLKETEKLVKTRTVEAYQKVAELLSDLHEALVATRQPELAKVHARKLASENSRLYKLVAALRSSGLLN